MSTKWVFYDGYPPPLSHMSEVASRVEIRHLASRVSVENRRACAGLSLHRLSWYYCDADGSRNSLRSALHRRRLPTGGSTPAQDANKSAHPFTLQGAKRGPGQFFVLLRRRWKPQLVAVGPAPTSIAHGGLHAYPRRQQVGASIHVKDLRPRPASAPCAARTAPALPGS